MKTKVLLALMITSLTAVAGPQADLYEIPLKDIHAKSTSLKDYKGKVLLVVNVASQCGLTPQYKELQELHTKYKDKGFSVLGFPSNDFNGQEPGTNEEILKFCTSKYQVTFPMFDKVSVKGPSQHPLYAALTGKDAPFPGDVKWNFGKFLVGRDGKILQRFEPRTTPESPEVTKAIEDALKAQK